MLKLKPDREGVCRYACPDCGAVCTKKAARSGKGPVEIEITCDCGRRQIALVDTRRFPRKAVHVKGTCHVADGADFAVEVVSLSEVGVGFEVCDGPSLAPGDEIVVKLRLKEDLEVMVSKDAVVRQVRGDFVGAEFDKRSPGSAIDRLSDSALAYFTFKAPPEDED
jgi:hypothetical protein